MESTGQSVALTSQTPAAAPAAKAAAGPTEAQDEASAVLMARLQDRKIEVLSQRTADSTTYALPSGELQTEAYAGPVRVKQDGRWKDIDTSLSDTGADLTPAAAVADITVSDGGDTKLVSASQGAESFGLGWQDKLPVPEVKGSTASYDLGGGQTLSVKALAQGFSENITLSQRPGDDTVSYRIPLHLDGLKLSQAASGHLLLKNTDGDLVAEAPAPVMWDASTNPASGESANQQRVDTKIETAVDGAQTLVLTPDTDFLAGAMYPVTVDPTTTLAVTTDTWLQTPDYPDSQVSSEELKSGTYDGGSDLARSYLKFDVSKFVGKHITDTNFALYDYYASTCASTGSGTTVRRITSDWSSTSVTWATRPSSSGTGAVVNLVPHGYDASCPANWSNWDIDTIVQAWADGSPNYGLMVYGTSESDSTTWRRFRSANYATSGYAPKLTVTYNSKPAVPTAMSPVTGTATSDTTPTLSAKATDADGNSLYGHFEIWNTAHTTMIASGDSSTVASGSTFSWTTTPALAQGAYQWRVLSRDGTDGSVWSAWNSLTIDTVKPAATVISSDDFPAGGAWSGTPDENGIFSGTFDFTPPASDVASVVWNLDNTGAHTLATTGAKVSDTLTFSQGKHTLSTTTHDKAGNVSPLTTYVFYAGSGASLDSPSSGDRTARRVSLTASSDTAKSYTGVTYQFRRGETDAWWDVPAMDAKYANGSAVTAWPVLTTGGAPAPLTWNVTDSLPKDGALDIRAVFTNATATAYSQPQTITLDRNAGTAPSAGIGPGSVNTLTGDFGLSATDASAFDLTVSRTASSRRPTAGADAEGQAAIFGPQWTSGTTAEITDSDWAYVRQTSMTSVAVVDVDGSETAFTATSSGGWKPEPGSEDLKLVGSFTGTFTLKDDEGTTTTFVKVDTAATTWQVSTTYLPTASSATTTVVSEKVGTGSNILARPKYLIAPTPAVSADQCQTAIDSATAADRDWFSNTATTTGCRVLQFVYATSTTATSSALGNYAGQVEKIKLWAITPGDSTTTATTVAQYAYDNAGQLREEWDPRITPALTTAYTYDSAGRIITLTPPGELSWTLTYGKIGNAGTAGDGMLLNASRPNLTAGTKNQTDGTNAITSVVYDVPLTDTNAPAKMSGPDVAAWGQTDIPSDATAVFPPDSVPSSNSGSDLSAGDYQRATITYADASGRQVNTVVPGGHITTTEYDGFGNTVRELSASNRELALATSGDGLAEQAALGIDQLPTAADRAELLSTRSVYSKDGLRDTDEYGPLHQVTLTSTLQAGTGGTDLPAGSQVPARQHTVNTYDVGRPTDGTATVTNQITTTKVGAKVDGYPSDADVRTTSTEYDWVKGLVTATITDPGGKALKQTTAYDSQGRVIKTALPMSSGSDAGATVTTYYSATGTGTCNGRPEWADLVCSTGPAGAITGGGSNPTQLPTKTVQYDRWGNTARVTETANSVTRTTTSTYDAAGRLKTASVSGGVGTAVPDSTTTYDPDSGDVATVTSNGQTVTHTYDVLGREISYNDGAGNTTATQYDPLGRPVKTTDSAPSTTTYTYDTSKDPRGLETSRTDSVAGTFAATYGADGELTTESLPGGYTLTVAQDETGAETSRIYTEDSDSTVIASDSTSESIHGQVVADTNTAGQTRDRSYTYDAPGRLTRADDTAPDGVCTRRDYTFDNNTNRTDLAVAISDVGAACSSAGATTLLSPYDSADRLEATGTVYDVFGRTTARASGATIGYYANDLVHQQTSGASRQTWTLDAVGRLAAWTTESDSTGTWTQTAAKTNHYGSDGDSPDWIQETPSTLTRNVQGSSGDLDAITSATSATVLQLTDVHGDVTVALPLNTSTAPTALAYDEYGNPEGDTTATRYGWLGGKQRSSETVTGATLMGVRLYDPTIGRFLSVDPVPGGNANAYEYCNGDPVNRYDLNGKWGIHFHRWASWGRSWVGHHKTYIAGLGAGVACGATGWTGVGLGACVVGASLLVGAGSYRWSHRHKRRTASGYASHISSAFAGAMMGYPLGRFWRGRWLARRAYWNRRWASVGQEYWHGVLGY
ncbi:DNRLRE domain-containing protein [Streptomyces sp. NPDC059378]|uniref:DNRLRE domain-containing protein n=1 Tax=Streptomyces sp. NPDC059378 TaxID=3346815 RepID=UPI00367A89CE